MKPRIAAIGSFVPAGAAVVGSVTLSLVILHSPPAGLIPGTAPADRGHAAAVILPAPHVSRPRANTQLELPHSTSARIATVAPRRQIPRPAPPASTHHTPAPPPPPPPVQTVPTPVTQPVTTPVSPPVMTPPTIPTNNGRWSRPQTKTWKAAAAKQNERVQKGKPPWAGPKQSQPTATAALPAAAAAPPAPPATPAAPDTPPDQSKSPPGQEKVPPGQGKKGQSPHG